MSDDPCDNCGNRAAHHLCETCCAEDTARLDAEVQEVERLRKRLAESDALAAALYGAVKGYYNHCTCRRATMEEVNLAGRRAIYAYEKVKRP